MRHTLHLIVGILIAAGIVCLLVLFIAWIYIPEKSIKVKFSTFKKWYHLAPLKWGLGDFYVTRYDYHGDQDVHFGFFGTIPYMLWKSQLHRIEKKRVANKDMERLLRSVQSDIDNVREQSNRALQKARIMMEKIKHI